MIYSNVQVESGGGTRISPAAALHGVAPREIFEAVEHPAEPTERDRPVRCPPPENSILQVACLACIISLFPSSACITFIVLPALLSGIFLFCSLFHNAKN